VISSSISKSRNSWHSHLDNPKRPNNIQCSYQQYMSIKEHQKKKSETHLMSGPIRALGAIYLDKFAQVPEDIISYIPDSRDISVPSLCSHLHSYPFSIYDILPCHKLHPEFIISFPLPCYVSAFLFHLPFMFLSISGHPTPSSIKAHTSCI